MSTKKMKLKSFFVALMSSMMIFSAVVVAGDIQENLYADEVLYEQNVETFSAFHHSVFISGWSSSAAVPGSQSVTVNRGGRIYQGTLSIASTPTLDMAGSWGAIFSGTVTFTGIVMRAMYIECIITEVIDFAVIDFAEASPHKLVTTYIY